MTNDDSVPEHAAAENNDVREPTDAGAPASRRRRTKAIVWTAAGIAATLIGAASIAVPLIADAQRRTTSTDTLVLNPTNEPEAAPLPTSAPVAAAVDVGLDFSEVNTNPTSGGAGANMTFWVPVDAPWASFPDDGWAQPQSSGSYGCSQAQYDWLVAHAVSEATSGGLFDFVNAATDGGALAIRSIRAEGAFAPQTPARIQVDCEGPGYGEGNDYTVIEVVLGADAPATVIASSVLPAGSLFTRDLAPGEVGQIIMTIATLDPQQDFEGRIVADVVAGTEEATVTVQEGVLWRSAPAVRSGVLNISMDDGVLRCVGLPVSDPLFEESSWGGGPYSTMPQYYAPNDGAPCAPGELENWVGGLAVEY